MSIRLVPLSSLVLAGVMALAGCSNAGGSAATAATSGSSATPAGSSPSTALAQDATVDGAALAAKIRAAMTAKGRVAMTMTMAGQSFGTSVVDLSTTPPRTSVTVTESGMTIEVRVIGSKTYLKGLPTEMTGGKAWVEIDSGNAGSLSDLLQGSLSSSDDPAALTDRLKGATAVLVDRAGGGYHYRVTTATTGVVGSLPTDQASALAGLVGKDVSVDYYLDSSYLPTKIEISALQMTMTYADWGTAPAVVAPPAAEVGSLPTGMSAG